MSAGDTANGLWRLSEQTQETASHSFGVAEADLRGDELDRLLALFDPRASNLRSQASAVAM